MAELQLARLAVALALVRSRRPAITHDHLAANVRAAARERAVAATQHPALRLPPLPNLEDGAQLAAAAAKAIASGSGGEAASAQRAPVVPATPAAASVTAPRALTEDWGANDMAEDDDIGDYV